MKPFLLIGTVPTYLKAALAVLLGVPGDMDICHRQVQPNPGEFYACTMLLQPLIDTQVGFLSFVCFTRRQTLPLKQTGESGRIVLSGKFSKIKDCSSCFGILDG